MKQCIWCQKLETETRFENKAHTIPRSLGGKNICLNVCDECNSYFGNHHNGDPAVETIIKETFNISKLRLSDTFDLVKQGKKVSRVSSIYFNINLKNPKIDLKMTYKLQKNFQQRIGKQIRKGLYKIFLEELERKKLCANIPKYDFIRAFARRDQGDLPVFYFHRRHGIIASGKDWGNNPQIFFDPNEQFKYLIRHSNFFEFEFFGHVFGLASSPDWTEHVDEYIKETALAKMQFFSTIRHVNHFNDIDLMLSILDDVAN